MISTREIFASLPKLDLLDIVMAKYKQASSVTMKFTQKQENLTLGSVKESFGTIQIQRPSQYRWETLGPEKSTLVSNGKKIWFYTPAFHEGEKGQLMIKNSAEVQSKLAIDLLSGQIDLKKSFKTKRLGNALYELVPVIHTGNISKIQLSIEKSTKLVYKIALFTTTNNKTELDLTEIKLGTGIKKSEFEFTVPPNTEEIE